MFRKTIWRQIDLREKQNKPMFSQDKEITRVIIEAVKRGDLKAYDGDSLTKTLTYDEMAGKMAIPDEKPKLSAEEKALGFEEESSDDWGAPKKASSGGTAGGGTIKRPKLDSKGKPMKDRKGKVIMETVAVAPPPPPKVDLNLYRPKDLYELELKEDMIFDKKRSRMYHDIKTISLHVPSALPSNLAGIEKPIATFKYSDLVKVFRANPENAIWFNAQNDAQHKNLADAFELWLFSSYITKVSNPSDSRLSEVYGGDREGILAAQQTASDLVEYEYNLWSF